MRQVLMGIAAWGMILLLLGAGTKAIDDAVCTYETAQVRAEGGR